MVFNLNLTIVRLLQFQEAACHKLNKYMDIRQVRTGTTGQIKNFTTIMDHLKMLASHMQVRTLHIKTFREELCNKINLSTREDCLSLRMAKKIVAIKRILCQRLLLEYLPLHVMCHQSTTFHLQTP